MKTMVLVRPGAPLQLRDVPVPRVPRSSSEFLGDVRDSPPRNSEEPRNSKELLVKVESCAVCRTSPGTSEPRNLGTSDSFARGTEVPRHRGTRVGFYGFGSAAQILSHSVANLTRVDGVALFERLRTLRIVTRRTTYALEEANDALAVLRSGELTGTAVLEVSR
jgi:hypothetical protein